MDLETLGFPLWLRINRFITLMRSDAQLLADHPKLYWSDGTTPGANGSNSART